MENKKILSQQTFSEPLTYEEQQSLANNYLKIFIKRFQLITKTTEQKFKDQSSSTEDEEKMSKLYNEKDKFKYELQLLKATFEMALVNHTNGEKLNLLNHFPKLIPAYFCTFLMDQLDKQFMDQKMRIDMKYLDLMNIDLKEMGLINEAFFIKNKFKESLSLDSLKQKIDNYNNITQGLTHEFQYLLDKQPLHNTLLKAHLNFLMEFIKSLEKSEIEEFTLDYNELVRQMEIAQESADVGEKFKFVEMFNDVSTKFGRFLEVKFDEYKCQYYEN